jgi:hypothetical protein
MLGGIGVSAVLSGATLPFAGERLSDLSRNQVVTKPRKR